MFSVLLRQTSHHREKYSQDWYFVLYPSRLDIENAFTILRKNRMLP